MCSGDLGDEGRSRNDVVKGQNLHLSQRHFAKALVATPTEATSLQVFTRLQETRGGEVLSKPLA